MGVIYSVIIVIAFYIILYFLHQTKHPFLYPILFLNCSAFILYSSLPKMKIANLETEGTILVCGLFRMCFWDMILAKMDDKKR